VKRWIIPGLVVLVLAAAVMLSTGRREARFAEEPSSIDHDYIMALGVADRFLDAWATRDGDRGYPLLSDRLKKTGDQATLKLAIAGVSNPHHQSFEIFGGRRQDKDRYVFSIYLYESVTAQTVKTRPRPAPLTLTLVRSGGDNWLVDDFPRQATM
jgi:hypothetical protein